MVPDPSLIINGVKKKKAMVLTEDEFSKSTGYCGAFARLVSSGGGAFANFALPGGRELANPGAIPPELWHALSFLSEYNYTEGFTGKKADWLIYQGQE